MQGGNTTSTLEDDINGNKLLKGKFGAQVEKPVDPTKAGYKFNGWKTDLPNAFPAENTTYTALWKRAPKHRGKSHQKKMKISGHLAGNFQYLLDYTI